MADDKWTNAPCDPAADFKAAMEMMRAPAPPPSPTDLVRLDLDVWAFVSAADTSNGIARRCALVYNTWGELSGVLARETPVVVP